MSYEHLFAISFNFIFYFRLFLNDDAGDNNEQNTTNETSQ